MAADLSVSPRLVDHIIRAYVHANQPSRHLVRAAGSVRVRGAPPRAAIGRAVGHGCDEPRDVDGHERQALAGLLPAPVRPADRGHAGAGSHSSTRPGSAVHRAQRAAYGQAGHRSCLPDDRAVRRRPGHEGTGGIRRDSRGAGRSRRALWRTAARPGAHARRKRGRRQRGDARDLLRRPGRHHYPAAGADVTAVAPVSLERCAPRRSPLASRRSSRAR